MEQPTNISGPLWEEAKRLFYNDIGDTKGEKLKDSTTLADTVESLRNASKKATKEYGEHTIRKGITFKLGRIMKRLEVFMQVGDAYMSLAPETVSLVWMAFRMIFTGFLKDAATCEFLTDAVDQISDILFICNIFEIRYSKTNGMLDTATGIKDRVLAKIPPLYAAVLKFSYQSRKLFAHGKLTRSFMSWRSTELDETLVDAQRKRSILQDTAGIGFQEATLDALQDIQVDTSIIREVAEVIQSEVAPGIKNVQIEQNRVRDAAAKEKIEMEYNKYMEWLKSGPIAEVPAPGRIQSANRDKIHPGSADWVLNDLNFREWRDCQTGETSWLWGNGGFGKSFLMSAIIDHLESKDRVWPKTSPLVVYFFCRKGDEATSIGKRIFLHLIIQLYDKIAPGTSGSNLVLLEKCSRVVGEVWSSCKVEDRHDSTLVQLKSSLLPMFTKLVDALGTHVFVLIDGLDECQDEETFVEVLLELPKDSNVHLMISSRPDVYHRLRSWLSLNIEVSALYVRLSYSQQEMR
jgi:hypothetical protein